MANGYEKTMEISVLFNLYKNLLTPKQAEYFELYFDEDLSFQEIADEFNISKAAIHDSITKTTKSLYDLEEKLALKAKREQLTKIIDEHKNSNNEEVIKIVEKLEQNL
ncbi:YlxM family DNA-binding protein [[Acholeplasma] multilocale]|uniref:YlxM family DNA-binding protein n=1 Tax=[Acholeplasma] multilocale TaxID=264638 RepID=UPI00047B1E02|nr:YlxM family DNA-binding protein [[Acholeplasma] multilocale]